MTLHWACSHDDGEPRKMFLYKINYVPPTPVGGFFCGNFAFLSSPQHIIYVANGNINHEASPLREADAAPPRRSPNIAPGLRTLTLYYLNVFT